MSTPALKYSVQDRSILLPHYKRLLVEPTLPFIPASLSPNAITHGGHLLNLAALLLVCWGAGMDRGWPFFAAAILVHAYLWCDNADGSHARRTNQCSAKGEFLDHGLDLLNATYIACMTVVCLGAPPFWSVVAAVVVPAAAAVTYWEQAETGVFELGLLNQVESIFCLSVALVARGLFGVEAIQRVHVGAFSLPVLILVFVSVVALFGILRSAMRVFRKRGRLLPFVAPLAFGAAVTAVAATGALGTLASIVAGAVVYVFLGIRQLTLRVHGQRPLIEHGVLAAAALLAILAAYRALDGAPAADVAVSIDWATAMLASIAFGGLALARALEGHRAVERLDRG
jgi:phosphatidylglycerophosphate synthase